MSKTKFLVFSAFALLFALTSASFADAQTAVPSCPFTSSDGKVVTFPYTRLVSGNPASWPGSANYVDAAASLSAGTYTVKTLSWDGYAGRESISQSNEQWNVEAYKGSTLLGTVGPTTDLTDYVIANSKLNTFTSGLTIAQNTTKVRAKHAFAGISSDSNSVVPICVAFKKIETPSGCTLTQGYWKTHSSYGKAPYDDAWALLPNGANTTFFLSGKTWYQVFWTAPKDNAYYQLAYQYMAAKLNILNGANGSAIQPQITSAETLFGKYTPAQIAALKGSNATRKQFITLAGKLGNYNEGLIGPGHCN